MYLDDDGVYGIGDNIEVTVTFSENVTATGSPRLELTIGSSARNAAYKSTTGSKVVFGYTVAVGDSDTDGISIAADKLSLNGGSTKDSAENDADLSHSVMSTQSGHKVDGIRPTITSVYLVPSTSNQDDVHTIDESLFAGVSFSENVYVGSHPAPRMKLNFEGATKTDDFFGLFPEDLRTINMTRSAKGSIEEPGKNAAQKRGLNKSINEQTWSLLTQQLTYKAEYAGRQFVKMDLKFTSKTCSKCGIALDGKLETYRLFVCHACGLVIDRDLNAARNIEVRGFGALEAHGKGEDLSSTAPHAQLRSMEPVHAERYAK